MTLISMVGDDISRIVPLLYAYREEVKDHILLCDDAPSDRERAQRLSQGMKRFATQWGLAWEVHLLVTDEDSFSRMFSALHPFLQKHKTIYLNITDGAPAMAMVLGDLVRKAGGSVVSYDHFDNDIHLIAPDGKLMTRPLESCIDLESYLTLLDYRILTKTTAEELLPRRAHVLKLYANESLFTKVRKNLLDVHFGMEETFAYAMFYEILDALKALGIIDTKNRLIPSMQKALQGDLLEEYLFWLCDSLSPDDIALGVKIDFDDSDSEPLEQRRVHNEFDILLMHRNRPYTVECKFSKHLDGLEFVYKYDAVIDYFGKASKAIIANISPKHKEHYLDMKSSENFRHSTLRRAHMAGVAVYHESRIDAEKFKKQVEDFFEMKARRS
jgi:hypothetical protein